MVSPIVQAESRLTVKITSDLIKVFVLPGQYYNLAAQKNQVVLRTNWFSEVNFGSLMTFMGLLLFYKIRGAMSI